jgi:riboflavin synthase
MFTGLVEQIGTISRIERNAKGVTLEVACAYDDYVLGESIAVNGACLTVTADRGGAFTADASLETLDKTTLGDLASGGRVHLERALRAGERLGGHLVTGHVDGVGTIVEKSPLGDAMKVVFEAPAPLAPFMAPKGSVTVHGVSLTVNGVHGRRFDVVLVPFTRTETVFDALGPGARVNLEADVLAKYVARLLGRPGVDGVDDGEGVSLDLLRRHGYL